MFYQAANSYSHYFLLTHLHIVKPQSLKVRSAVEMFNQAAYSYSHYFLLTHLHIVKLLFTEIKSTQLLIDCKLATGTLTYMDGNNAYHILLFIHIR